MSQWMITQGDQQFPVGGLADLKGMAERGELKAGDLIQPPGTTEWIYAAEVPQLASLFKHEDDAPAKRGPSLLLPLVAVALGGVVLLFGGASLYMAQHLPTGKEKMIGDGGLAYSQMIVTSAGESLRAEADPKASTTVPLKKDEVLDLLAKRGDFYRARTLNGAEGWIPEDAVIPMYQLAGAEVKHEYDPLYNPDRYIEVANANWQQLPPDRKRPDVRVTVFQFDLHNQSQYTMTDIVLQATVKDAKGSEVSKIEFEVEGEIPAQTTTLVGTLKPEEGDPEAKRRLLTNYTFSLMSEQDPELQLRYVDGVEVEFGEEEFTNANIDIIEIRSVPDEQAKPATRRP